MQFQSKRSPLVFVVPFAIMFAVVGMAMFAASSGTDLRSHASNNAEKNCVATCTKMGGSMAPCVNICPKVINGTVSCNQAATTLGITSSIFITTCANIAPKNRTCDQICSSINLGNTEGAGIAKNVCKTVCTDVAHRSSTCDQACSSALASVPHGQSYQGACASMCTQIPVKTPTPSDRLESPTLTPAPAASKAACMSKCKPARGLAGENAAAYQSRCMSICTDIASGVTTCPTACTGMESFWANECRLKLCSR